MHASNRNERSQTGKCSALHASTPLPKYSLYPRHSNILPWISNLKWIQFLAMLYCDCLFIDESNKKNFASLYARFLYKSKLAELNANQLQNHECPQRIAVAAVKYVMQRRGAYLKLFSDELSFIGNLKFHQKTHHKLTHNVVVASIGQQQLWGLARLVIAY